MMAWRTFKTPTLVGATAGAFGGVTFAEDLAPILARWPPIAPAALELAVAVTVIGLEFHQYGSIASTDDCGATVSAVTFDELNADDGKFP